MATADGTVVPYATPAARMASWSFYLGVLGFLFVAISPIARSFPLIVPFFVYGGLALSVIAIVLGVIGLASVNRASAVAGILFGVLGFAVFAFYAFYLGIIGLGG